MWSEDRQGPDSRWRELLNCKAGEEPAGTSTSKASLQAFNQAFGEPSAKPFIGRYNDLVQNWLGLVTTAGLSRREFMEAQCLFAAKIGVLENYLTPPTLSETRCYVN